MGVFKLASQVFLARNQFKIYVVYDFFISEERHLSNPGN